VDATVLRSVPLFAELSEHDRERIAIWADEIDVPEGKELAREGDFAYEFFVILDGTASVSHDSEVVAELGPDDYFGEIGLLESERRTATVTATSPLRAIVIFGPQFRHLEREMPELAQQIRTAIRERINR
jgi:CRP-like cAMP-binding protein